MLITILWFLAGLAALIIGADLLVRGASRLAFSLGVSKLVIGLTVIAFGTSAPELAISIQSGLEGKPDLLLGNIVGSNITNILLILGISALILPITVHPRLIRLDVPIMLLLTLLLLFFVWNGSISVFESFVLVTLLTAYLIYLARNSGSAVPREINTARRSKGVQFLFIGIGLVLLISGARLVVSSAVELAEWFGISELIIGLTIVAFGTSLPEVTTAVVAAVRKERELLISGVIGSNILNILAVLGITGLLLFEPIPVTDALIRFDIMILLAASFACIPIFFTGHLISRKEGALFFSYYIAYIIYLFLASAEHDALPLFSRTMLLFVLPITLFTIITIATREWNKRKRIWNLMDKNK